MPNAPASIGDRQDLERVPLSEVRLHPDNTRRGDLPKIVESMRTRGWWGACGRQQSTGFYIWGNQRAQAGQEVAQLIERAQSGAWAGTTPEEQAIVDSWKAWPERFGAMDALPTFTLDVDDEEALDIMLQDNAASDAATYDRPKLSAQLAAIAARRGTLEGTGYTPRDLSEMLRDVRAARRTEPIEIDDGPPDVPSDPVTKLGDIWRLGRHRLLCGDSRDADDVALLLCGSEINLAFTSPPYADRREYDPSTAFRPVRPDDYVEWFRPVAANTAEHLATDGSWFVNIKPGAEGLDTELYVFDLVLAHVREWGWHFATEFCWERSGLPGHATQRFKNQFEPIYQFVHGRWKLDPWANAKRSDSAIAPSRPGEVGFGSWADPASNFTTQGEVGGEWFPRARVVEGLALPGNRLPSFAGSHEATGHTAAFPVGLPAWFIRAYTDQGDTIYDPFMGSGSTLLAAEQEGRTGFGIEIGPGYCDVICRRFQTRTGVIPTRGDTPHDFL